nr:GTP-binding protein [uncultured Cellulosilyticum sp.]
MIKVNIISGFLGAGKTTLIKKLIKEAFQGEKLVLIENEFGEIGVDSGFLKDAGIKVQEINAGCICCSLVGNFEKALQEVITTYKPERIIIEPSGVGKLSDIQNAILTLPSSYEVAIEYSVAVVDARKCKMYKRNYGEFFINQVSSAQSVVLSRTQGLAESKIEECITIVRALNEGATIITTPWEQLTGKQMLAAFAKNDFTTVLECDETCTCHHHEEKAQAHHHMHTNPDDCHHEGHHHAEDIFVSWGVETCRKFTKEGLEDILKTFEDKNNYGTILRAKGIVEAEDGTWLHFNYVPEESNVVTGPAEYTGRICVIGVGLLTERLQELFN